MQDELWTEECVCKASAVPQLFSKGDGEQGQPKDPVWLHGTRVVSRARPFSPVLVGVAGSAAGKKGLVSLGHSLLQCGMQ